MAASFSSLADREVLAILKTLEPKIAAASGEELLKLLELTANLRLTIEIGKEGRRKGGHASGLTRLRKAWAGKDYMAGDKPK